MREGLCKENRNNRMYCWWSVVMTISSLQSAPQHASPGTFSVSMYFLPYHHILSSQKQYKHLEISTKKDNSKKQFAERNDNVKRRWERWWGLRVNWDYTWNREKMCGGEVLVWQADSNADNNYLTYIRSLRQNLHPFVDAMFDYKGTNNIKSNQSLALSVCKINTISFTYLSDSIPLFQLYEGDSTKGILVRCVMKCECVWETKRETKATFSTIQV